MQSAQHVDGCTMKLFCLQQHYDIETRRTTCTLQPGNQVSPGLEVPKNVLPHSRQHTAYPSSFMEFLIWMIGESWSSPQNSVLGFPQADKTMRIAYAGSPRLSSIRIVVTQEHLHLISGINSLEPRSQLDLKYTENDVDRGGTKETYGYYQSRPISVYD